MRVYELSKELGVASKDVIQTLKELGIDISSHMSVLSQNHIDLLKKKYLKGKEVLGDKEKLVEKKIIEKTEIKGLGSEQVEKQNMSIQENKLKPQIKHKNESLMQQQQSKDEKEVFAGAGIKKEIYLRSMTLGDFAREINVSSSDVILNLLKKGFVYNKNQMLTEELVERLARSYDVEVLKSADKASSALSGNIAKLNKTTEERRLPVVVIIGHVDHGKTTLLDFIRKTRVAAKEKGGITQHLGAYQVATKQGKIVFLDTPGHEAFRAMRMRGARVADLAILVVAADDGVMPQTIEAIKQAQSVNLPIIVAINKVDKVDSARVEVVKNQLSQQGLLVEDWGGDIVSMPISAKLGQGVDDLLDMIILQSDLMDLSTDSSVLSKGYILESKMEKGLGVVATFLAQYGTIHVGDFFVCGDTVGKVSVLIDSYGNRVQSAGPSVPVQISGLNDIPKAGDLLQVISESEFYSLKSKKLDVKKGILATKTVPTNTINIILKTDNDSSREAILGSIDSFSKKNEKKIYIVQASIGNINESDILLAENTGSVIYGFGVKLETKAAQLAQKESISVKNFYVIYHLIDDIVEFAKSKKEAVYKRIKIGEISIRKVFDIKGIGVVPGFYVKEGKVEKGAHLIIWRGKTKIGEGVVQSLQREKKTVKELGVGLEGALFVDGFRDWSVDDRAECFVSVKVD